MIRSHILLLPWVVLDAIEFTAINQSPLSIHHTAGPFARRLGRLAQLDKLISCLRKLFPISPRQRGKVLPVTGLGQRNSTQRQQRGKDIHVQAHLSYITILQPAVFPAQEERHLMSALIVRAFLPRRPRIISPDGIPILIQQCRPGRTVVGHKDQDGVVLQPQFLQVARRRPKFSSILAIMP